MEWVVRNANGQYIEMYGESNLVWPLWRWTWARTVATRWNARADADEWVRDMGLIRVQTLPLGEAQSAHPCGCDTGSGVKCDQHQRS